MLAAYYTGQKKLDIRKVEKFECPPEGLLIRVNACAICGTDLKILNQADVKMEKGKKRSMPLPRITGHEFSGTIEESRTRKGGFVSGNTVVVAPTVPCMKCGMCRKGFYEMCDNLMVVGYDCDGGFAEYCAIDRKILGGGCVIKTEDSDDLDLFALSEPLSCVINCLELTPVTEGDTVVVIGSGPLGCFITELARIGGAGKTILIGHSREKLDSALICEPDVAIHSGVVDAAEAVLDCTGGKGAELVITACPSPEAQKDAVAMVAQRGLVNFFGGLPRNNSVVPIDTNLIHYKECVVTGTHGSQPGHVKQAVKLIRERKIEMEKYISHRFRLEEINRAFEQAYGSNRLKVLVKP